MIVAVPVVLAVGVLDGGVPEKTRLEEKKKLLDRHECDVKLE